MTRSFLRVLTFHRSLRGTSQSLWKPADIICQKRNYQAKLILSVCKLLGPAGMGSLWLPQHQDLHGADHSLLLLEVRPPPLPLA